MYSYVHANEFEEFKQKKIVFAFSTFRNKWHKHKTNEHFGARVSFALISMLALIITSYSKDYSKNLAKKRSFCKTPYVMSGTYMHTYAKNDAQLKHFYQFQFARLFATWNLTKRWATKHEKGSHFLSVSNKPRIFVVFKFYIRANCVRVCVQLPRMPQTKDFMLSIGFCMPIFWGLKKYKFQENISECFTMKEGKKKHFDVERTLSSANYWVQFSRTKLYIKRYFKWV